MKPRVDGCCWSTFLIILMLLSLLAAPLHGEPPPLAWDVAKIGDGLKAEGGTLPVTLLFHRAGGAASDRELTLSPTLVDGWGRTFWEGKRVTFMPGDKQKPARLEFVIPYPARLPIGGYLFRGLVRDSAGSEVTTVRVPTGRFARFDFQRDLVWLYWGAGYPSDTMAEALLQAGFNGSGGDALDYRFPYRWFKDHAVQEPTERYPEDVFLHPEGTQLAWYRKAHIGSAPVDGGFVLALMTDEVGARREAPAMRDVRLRLARANAWLNSPTLSRFNAFFQTDYLTWDEALREGFPRPNHPLHREEPIHWTADREFGDIEAPMLRVEVLRQTNPHVAFGPGATHCLIDGHFDSFNTRAYNNMSTLDFIAPFIAAQPMYNLRPGNRLVNLKPAWIDNANHFAANEHLFWAALACNDRLFLIYGPGDNYGSAPARADGALTPEGEWFRGLRQTIHGLRPVILTTHNRLEPSVVYLEHGHNDGGRNLMEGLVNCGIMPRGSKTADARSKLIFGISATPHASVVEAVKKGAGLVLGGKTPGDLASLGIEVPADPSASGSDEEIDLSPLAKAFPQLAGVKVIGAWGAGAKAKAGSGLEEVRTGDRLLAITGPLGKGWLLYLNVNLQTMLQPNGLPGSWSACNLSLLGDPTIPNRNAILVRTLLDRAGVQERFCLTDANGRIHPFMRAIEAETHDGTQRYLYVVSEAAGKMVKDTTDSKRDSMTLACDRRLSGTLKLFDPAIKAVRDLRAGTFLPLQADGKGARAELTLEAGQGTILSLLTEVPAGTLSLRLSQEDVAGLEQVQVELCRRGDRSEPLALPGHACRLRFLDPRGREVETMTRWALGDGPHVFDAVFALNDPHGEWTVEAEDMTDGTRAQAKLARRETPVGLRLAFAPAGKLVRGATNQGMLRIHNYNATSLPLQGLAVACEAPGMRVGSPSMTAVVPAGGMTEVPVAVEMDLSVQAGPALINLQRGETVLGGARLEIPEPYEVTFESTPYLDGDLIITEVRGAIRCTAAGRTPITIRPPDGLAPETTVTSAAPYAETPFAFPLYLTRAKARELRGLRNEGFDLVLQAPGLPPGLANYKLNILPLDRAPQRIGSLSGGKLAVRVNNFTKKEQHVGIALAPFPGGATEPWKESRVVPVESSTTFERPVVGLAMTIDPGVYAVPLEWTAGTAACEGTALSIEEMLEQEWWVKIERLEMGTTPRDDDEPPVLPSGAAARERTGWRRVVTKSVLWWGELASKSSDIGSLYAATQVHAPTARKVHIGYAGPTPPVRLWMNDIPVDGAWTMLAGKGGIHVEPVTLAAGPNRVIMAVDLPPGRQIATSLVLQDPETHRRDRSLLIGERSKP